MSFHFSPPSLLPRSHLEGEEQDSQADLREEIAAKGVNFAELFGLDTSAYNNNNNNDDEEQEGQQQEGETSGASNVSGDDDMMGMTMKGGWGKNSMSLHQEARFIFFVGALASALLRHF